MSIRDAYYLLLKEWIDALLEYQLNDPQHRQLDGAILCPACSVIHGRCHDAIYPLMYLAEETSDIRYLNAARKLFDWSEYMVCDDGSVFNDSQNTWNGITVFAAISLYRALKYHGTLLTVEERTRWEKRLLDMGEWLSTGITHTSKTNINYIATNSAAMALLGSEYHKQEWQEFARTLAQHCVHQITENNLLSGEGVLYDKPTVRGCYVY